MSRFLAALTLIGLTSGCAAHRVQTLESELANRDATIVEMEGEALGYRIQVATLQAQIDGMKKRDAELARTWQGLVDEFGDDLADGRASIVVFPDRTVLALGDTLTFASGSARIEGGDDALDRLAALLREHPERRFQVQGHTDAQPIHTARFASNWELGAARAIALVDELVDRGVSPNQLSAATYGDVAPLASNGADDGRALNRRVSIALETTVAESGAQQALLDAAKDAGGPVYAFSPITRSPVASAARP